MYEKWLYNYVTYVNNQPYHDELQDKQSFPFIKSSKSFASR